MQLKNLLAAIPVREIIGPTDRAVESIAYDSRRVQRNGLFVALRGEKSDDYPDAPANRRGPRNGKSTLV